MVFNLFKKKDKPIHIFSPKKLKKEYEIEVGNVPFYVYIESKGEHNITLSKILEEELDITFKNYDRQNKEREYEKKEEYYRFRT